MTMSFFGKLKNLSGGPPAPPKRTDNAGIGWPQDEFDDEDADMYEVPPCERPPVKVPPRHEIETNIYLETSGSAVPQRPAAPPPRPSKSSNPHQVEVFTDNTRKPPEVDRTEKPGRRIMPPPGVCPAPLPGPVSDDDDVYLDPNEEQEDNDDLYLEPEVCSPSPRGPTRGMPSHLTGPPALKPTMKPLVPRNHTHSVFPSMNDMKSALPDEDKRASFPSKLPPPTPAVKPPLPVNRKEHKSMPPVPAMPQSPADTKSVGGFRTIKQSGNENKEWFAGDYNRELSEDLLKKVRKDGAFLIRNSSNQSTNQPFTLAVLYQQKVYNIPIRFTEKTQSYVLGKEGKMNEKVFSSLDELVSYHKKNQILLIDSRSHAKHTANLTQAVRP